MANSGLWSDLHQNITLTPIHPLFSVSASQHCTIDQVHKTFRYRMKAKHQASRPTEIYTFTILKRDKQRIRKRTNKKMESLLNKDHVLGTEEIFI